MNLRIFIFISVFFWVGCKDFLEPKPFSFTTVENFYKTEKDVELALAGCYTVLIAGSIQGEGPWATFAIGMPVMLDQGTDESILRDGFSDPNFSAFGLASYRPDNELIRKNWFFLFAGVNRTNFLLENLDKVPINANRKTEIEAEARFLRGIYYTYLGMMYGGVPVYTTSEHDPKAARNTLKEVYDLVLEDFQFAYEKLPPRASKQGRANKWSAAGYLVKVYTYLASAKKSGVGLPNDELNSFAWVDASDFYIKGRDLAKQIIDRGGYELVNRYDNLFRETTADWQYKECLFMAEGSEVSSPNADHGIWLYYLIPTGANALFGGGYGWFRPTGEMYHKYHVNDKRRAHNVSGVLNAASQKEIVDGVSYYVPIATPPSSRNYCITKFRYKDPKEKIITGSYSEGNYPMLRYADILLLYSEALFQTGAGETAARELLTEVRERSRASNMSIADLNAAYLKSDFMEELLEERSRELCFEGWRRIDLIRFNKYKEAIDKLTNNINYGAWNMVVPTLQQNWAAHKIWFPIPQSQREMNPNLKPNEGWY